MRTWMLFITVLSILCMAPTCIPPQPGPDAAPGSDVDATTESLPASPCTRACLNLAVLGCSELGPNCVQTCEHVVQTHLTPFDTACIYGARSVESVRECPGIVCAAH